MKLNTLEMIKMNKKIVIGIVMGTIMVLGVVVLIIQKQPQSQKYTGPIEKITLAAFAGEAGALVYIAKEQGYFEENGLDVEIKDYQSGKAAADVLIAGEADISISAGFVFVSNGFDNPDLRVLGTVAIFENKELVARKDKGIRTINDLIGKKIGVTKKSGGEFSLGLFLIFNGLLKENVKLVDLKPLEIIEAVVSGDVDAGFTWDPNVYNMKQILGDNAISWPGHSDFYFVVLTKKDWIENNPVATERFMKSLLETEEYIKTNSEESKKFIKNKFDYEQGYIDYSWPKQEYVVVLPQAMLIALEDQARWAIENKLTDATEVPNYLDYVYLDALYEVKPEVVTIIR